MHMLLSSAIMNDQERISSHRVWIFQSALISYKITCNYGVLSEPHKNMKKYNYPINTKFVLFFFFFVYSFFHGGMLG